MLILSDKLLLDIQLMHTFMPNMIRKPWMVSSAYGESAFEELDEIFYIVKPKNIF